MIESFADPETEKIFKGLVSRKLPPDIQRAARRKLLYLHSARDLRDILAPPGNRLEELRGNTALRHPLRVSGCKCRAGQHSIRINDQWRICFAWSQGAARDVEIVDYHK